MSKMSELSAELDELKKCGEILIGISDTLKEMFSTREDDEPAQPSKERPRENTPSSEAVPKPEPKALTLTDVRSVLAEKSRNGFTSEVKELLIKFGAEKLSEIDPTKYPTLLAEAEVIGNA